MQKILSYFEPNGTETVTHLGKPRKLIINSADGFLYTLLERPTNAHYLADTLHAAAKQLADATELLQIPAWKFNDDVIHARLETCARDLRDCVLNLIEGNTEPKLRSDKGKRIARGFRRKCRRA